MFESLDKLWGPHTCDRFASKYNRKCDIFNSKYWCKESSGVDAFKQVWSFDNNWFVPPPTLIVQTIKKAEKEKASGTLVLPEWKSAPFWPFICDRYGFKQFIKSYKFFTGNVTHRGRGNNGIFGRPNRNLRFLAIRIEF